MFVCLRLFFFIFFFFQEKEQDELDGLEEYNTAKTLLDSVELDQ